MIDLNCLSYWFPKLKAAGIPVPETRIVKTDCDLLQLCDGREPKGVGDLFRDIRAAAHSIGLPCFFRTGHTSGKHDWENTCCLTHVSAIPQHVYALVEFSAMAGMIGGGLDTDVWAVREMLPVQPRFTAFRGKMPITKEFRFFVKGDGQVVCHHPYWPPGSIQHASIPEDEWRVMLQAMSMFADEDEHFELTNLASNAAKAVGGPAWSVDLLKTDRGWYVTDMALAAQSFHWDGCEYAKELEDKP